MGFNKISLCGGQICDYLYIQNSQLDPNNQIEINSPPEWDAHTVFFSNFKNHNLKASESNLIGKINGYELRRKAGANSYTEHVVMIKDSMDKIIDYAIANNSSYTYYLYPRENVSEGGLVLSPSVSNEIKTRWDYWSLMVVDETEDENVFYLDKMFKFELNLSVDDMTNNASVSIIPNFTKHPTIQYGTSNYWSSSLTSLCGYINCSNNSYIQTPDMINELKSLTSDMRRKFLKDMDGNIWEVKISAAINISTDNLTAEKVKSVKISWAEVGDAKGISIINNPNAFATSWVLTKSGQVKPYIGYQWNNDEIWDNSKRWTSHDKVLSANSSNMGRDLYSEEGKT